MGSLNILYKKNGKLNFGNGYRTKDLSGYKFDRLSVIKLSENSTYGKYLWLCKCICGNFTEIRSCDLLSGNTKSCGCYRKEEVSKRFSKDWNQLIGRKFGELIVLGVNFIDKKLHCQCDCGNYTYVKGKHLISGHTKSCGCLQKKTIGNLNRKHNLSNSKEHRIWGNMKSRCTNPNVDRYKDYGGRGIKVCDRWLDKEHGFENFLEDMGKCPKGLTLDRKDNNGNYSPDNCRWATRKEQNNNKRNLNLIEIDGKKMSLTIAAELLGVSRNTIYNRLKSDKLRKKGLIFNAD